MHTRDITNCLTLWHYKWKEKLKAVAIAWLLFWHTRSSENGFELLDKPLIVSIRIIFHSLMWMERHRERLKRRPYHITLAVSARVYRKSLIIQNFPAKWRRQRDLSTYSRHCPEENIPPPWLSSLGKTQLLAQVDLWSSRCLKLGSTFSAFPQSLSVIQLIGWV